MRILFCQWSAFMEKGIEKAFKHLNINYDILYYSIKDWDNDKKLENKLLEYIKDNNINIYDSIFSVNFSPIISEVCNKLGLKYISWVYDCPINIRRTDTLKNECNIIYFFDKVQTDIYISKGVKGARYMPLAVDTSVFIDGDIQGLKDKEYICDVSFVGKLYKSDYSYIYQYQDNYIKGYLDGILLSQEKIYGGYIIDECVNDALMKSINNNFAKVSNSKYSVIKPEVTYAIATEVTRRERYIALALLQKRFKVNLYSNESNNYLNKVNNKGYVDYYIQMPKAFYNAKINLNISLKAIQSGIPLRVLDVLGCGGFLITNYQHEIVEYFEPDHDLVIYKDIPDLIFKVQYYLTHEDERLRIAKNGYEKVRRDFTFKDRVEKMFIMDN